MIAAIEQRGARVQVSQARTRELFDLVLLVELAQLIKRSGETAALGTDSLDEAPVVLRRP